mgnify:CR=1 FL=1
MANAFGAAVAAGAYPDVAAAADRPLGQSALHDVPAEHGFRFFPGFYRHLPDTMARTPGRGRERVIDDLVGAEMVMIAREGGRGELVAPAHAPTSIDDFAAVTRFLVAWFGELGIEPAEQAFFLDRLITLLTSCDERRYEQWETASWWVFRSLICRCSSRTTPSGSRKT